MKYSKLILKRVKLKSVLMLLGFFFIANVNFAQNRELEPDKTVKTSHEVTINGKRIPYQATTGTQPVWNEEGKPVAALYFTYYERTDIKDKTTRPLVISFNGGPGSASVWMHIAYTGPRILNIDDEGYPVQPYGIKDNPNSLLDVADIVYVNPVNTAYSRIIDPETPGKEFFGVNEDIKYLAEWINTFVTRNNRWLSPKYLIGESYGTTRVSGLALELQESQWMYLNGVVLVSPTDLGIDRAGPMDDALAVPYFTAAAWFHKKLPSDLQKLDLPEALTASETFTINELLPKLALGGSINSNDRQKMAERISYFSGMNKEYILDQNLRVPVSSFWKELLREEGFTIGRLDSRYLGMDKKDAGEQPDFNSELTSWLHAFTPAINYYVANELNYKTDLKYNVFGPVHPWNRSGDNTGEDLRQAMAENPYLHVLVQSGYYDGACQYFNAQYNMWQMDPGGKLQERMHFKGYRSGHMMYLRNEDLKTSNNDLRDFIKKTTPAPGTPAQYHRK